MWHRDPSSDYYTLLLGEGGVISKVEEDGYMVTGALASMGMRAKLRGIKSTDGMPIFKADMQGTTNYALDGAPMYFPQNGSYDGKIAQLIVGDFKQAVYAIRQDVTVKSLIRRDPGSNHKGDRLQPGPAGHGGAANCISYGLGTAEPGNPDG